MDKYILGAVFLIVVAYFFFRSGSNNKVAEENIRLGAEFMAANKNKEGVIETASGLQYLVLQKGTENLPSDCQR